MSGSRFLVILLAGLLIAPLVTATEGRAAPQCAEFDLSDVVTSSSGVAVEPGVYHYRYRYQKSQHNSSNRYRGFR